jgi:hypothetical protein
MTAAASLVARLSRQPVRLYVLPCPSYDACEYTEMTEQTGNVIENKDRVKKSRSQEVESRMPEHIPLATQGVLMNSAPLDHSTLKIQGTNRECY